MFKSLRSRLNQYLGVLPSDQLGLAIRKSDTPRRRRGASPTPTAPIAPIDQDVQSSNLKKVVYFAETGLLHVHFNNGSIYYYYKIPKPIFDGLLAASSKGKYFISKIKDKYPFERKA